MIQGQAARPAEAVNGATARAELVRSSVAPHLAATSSRQGNPAHEGGRIQHPSMVSGVSAVGETRPVAGATSTGVHLDELLEFVRQHGCSDLHLSPGNPPMVRHNGEVRRLALPALTPQDVHALVYDVMNDAQRKAFEKNLESDFSFAMPGLGRFRVNVLTEIGGVGAVMRAVPDHVPSLDEIKAPALLKTIAEYKRGLVLVTGPTGSGKSTTLAAMVRHRNENSTGHIVTIEDPIEFTHESKGCLVRQRELGSHTKSFAAALQSALRDDPNVILVGELRDLETIRLASP
jgi:twitching motility protein PilT